VGQALIQLAKNHKASTVFATAGTDEKCRLVESLGAKRGINYKKEDFSKVILEETNGQGVDFIVDFVIGQGYMEKNIACCNKVEF
jgi:NADPH2:quinone reductase